MSRNINVSDECYRRLDANRKFFKKPGRKKASFSDIIIGLMDNFHAPEISKERMGREINHLRDFFQKNGLYGPALEEQMNELHAIALQKLNSVDLRMVM